MSPTPADTRDARSGYPEDQPDNRRHAQKPLKEQREKPEPDEGGLARDPDASPDTSDADDGRPDGPAHQS